METKNKENFKDHSIMETKNNENGTPQKKIITQIQTFAAENRPMLQDAINEWLSKFDGIQIVRVDIHQIHAPYFTTAMLGTVIYKTYLH